MHALAGRKLAPLRRRPTRYLYPRDVGKTNGPGVLEFPRRRTLNEPEPRHEAPLAAAGADSQISPPARSVRFAKRVAADKTVR